MPSTSAPVTASSTWWGSSQQSRLHPSSCARPRATAAAIARAFGVERAARAEPDEQPAAPGSVGDREVAEGGARLALVDQALERTVLDVVGHGLAVEHPDDERVCAAVGRGRGCR